MGLGMSASIWLVALATVAGATVAHEIVVDATKMVAYANF
jgi:hypothetical protein